MKSDPKECLYCQNNETQHELMIEVAKLSVSRLFIFKEQTYHGRCLVAYKDHVDDLNLLSDEDRNAFMADVAKVTRAMQKVFNPDKINYLGMAALRYSLRSLYGQYRICTFLYLSVAPPSGYRATTIQYQAPFLY